VPLSGDGRRRYTSANERCNRQRPPLDFAGECAMLRARSTAVKVMFTTDFGPIVDRGLMLRAPTPLALER
jgi:hypothetical protein